MKYQNSAVARLATKGSDNHAWQTEGLCAQADPDQWFAKPIRREQIAIAKAICYQCPVLTQCREAVLSRGEDYGVWAGLTPHEREQLKEAC